MFQSQVAEIQTLLKLLSYVRTHWWVFVLEFLCIFGMSLHKYYKTPPVYESHAALLIDSSRRQLYQSVLPTYGDPNANARKRNIAQLLMSQEVAERFKSQMNETFNADGRPAHLRYLFSGDGTLLMDDLREYLNLSWDKASDAYNLRCEARNAFAAREICKGLLNSIETYYPEIGEREAILKKDFLSRQISSLTQQIYERERAVASYQRKSSDFLSFVLSDSDDKGLQRLRSDEERLKHEIATNRAIRRLLLSVPRSKRGEYVTLETAISALTQRISELQYQVELTENANELNKPERLKNLHFEIDRLSSQLAALNDKQQEAFEKAPLPSPDVRKKLSELELEYKTDLIRLGDTDREIAEMTLKQNKYGEQRLEYDRLLAELNQRKHLLSSLYEKQQETELELSAGKAEIFTLQPPTLEGNRVEPQLAKYAYGALSMSLFACGITAALLLLLLPRLDNEEEVNRMNLPVLGKIPAMRKGLSRSDELSGVGLEYLKIMNYRILRETKDMKCPIVIVSSPHAREGKSTISRMLAQASQSPGRKILLIDGDLLTAHPNSFFGVKEDFTPGVKSLLTGEFKGPLAQLVVSTQHEGLSIIPRGGRIEPSSLPNFLDPIKGVLENLRKEYDVIFIDTPPLFAANLAHQWAGLADLIVLVARIYVTRPKDLSEAIQTCKIFSRSPVGIALNCVPISGPDKRVSNYYFSHRKQRSVKNAA